MKRHISLIGVVLIIISGWIAFSSFTQPEPTFNQLFKVYFSEHSTELNSRLLSLFKEVDKKEFSVDTAKALLEKARMEYKSIEGFVIYFLPGDAFVLNRPIINEMEEDDEITPLVPPHGFQYVEQLLYSDSAKQKRRIIKDEVDAMYSIIGKFNESISYMDFQERDVFEAMQMQMIKQFVLALANFETPDSRTGVQESSAFLSALKNCLHDLYPKTEANQEESLAKLYTSIDAAITNMSAVAPMKEPDYFQFYSKYYIPVSGALAVARDMIVSNNIYQTTPINYQIRSVFDPQAFNSFFFLPAKHMTTRDEVIQLGYTLFFDPALSANNLRACASCHQPGRAFTDGLPLSQSFEPGKFLTRNAPTIINSVFQRKLFHDGRAFTFETQAGQVMSNPLEMHNDFSKVADKLRKSPEYVAWFRSAFKGTDDTIITNSSVLTALAEYERSLIGMNSKFDKSVSGRENAMTRDEIEGFNLFMGKANCASCHFIPLFNGVTPPEYVETEWEILGVPGSGIGQKKKLDMDPGRAGVVNSPVFGHAFKVPTLRNIELTAPYMHNGVFKTLEEVVEFYDTGGGINLGYDVPFQTLATDSLHLTPKEKFQLISFMKTLTDTVSITSKPSKLPAFPDDQALNQRPVGGEY